MNIYEISEKSKFSVKNLRVLQKLGVLRVDESASTADPIRATLMNGDPLPAWQLVQLIEEPGLLLELGGYAERAESQVAALKDPAKQAAPKTVAAGISDAAKNEPEAVAALCDWLKQVIPSHSVGHAYLAARILLGIPEALRKSESRKIGRALLNCRNNPALAGWWELKPGVFQNSTVYRKLALDL